jgi:hypothetical protein
VKVIFYSRHQVRCMLASSKGRAKFLRLLETAARADPVAPHPPRPWEARRRLLLDTLRANAWNVRDTATAMAMTRRRVVQVLQGMERTHHLPVDFPGFEGLIEAPVKGAQPDNLNRLKLVQE